MIKRRVHVKGFAGKTRPFSIRSLTFAELNAALVAARQGGWIGNRDVLDIVVRAGLDGDRRQLQRADADVFVYRNLAREIWFATLQRVAEDARTLSRSAGVDIKIRRPRRYDFADLATPAMLFLIANEAETRDVAKIAKAYLAHAVEVTVRGQRLKGRKRDAMVQKHLDWLISTLFKTYGAGTVFDRLPTSYLPTPAHRFYAVMELTATLDWWQYRLAIDSFNYAVRALTWRANQAGGVDVPLDDVRLDVGVAMFLESVGPERHIPLPVVPQLFADSLENRISRFSPTHRNLLRLEAQEAIRRIREAWDRDPDMDEEQKKELAGGSIIEFANVVSRYPKLIERACFVYSKQFSTFAQERMTRTVTKVLEAAKLRPAAVYVLVEGPSDTIYVRAAIRAAEGDAQQIRVTACGGGSQVLARARSVAQDQRGASLVTVFDADAAKFHREAETLFKDRPLSRSFLFARGEVEDQFPPSAHVTVLQGRTGAVAKVEDFDPARPIVPQLKKWLWENEKTEFDKVAHAEELVAVLTDVAAYPEPIRHIAEAAIKFAAAARRHQSPPIQVLDRLMKTIR